MEAFVSASGPAIVLPIDGIDTDQLMPRQFLKGTQRRGFGQHLFDAWRYLDEGWLDKPQSERQPNPDFVLNQTADVGARFLVCGANFGCGSSREHAVWGLMEYGFRAVIAESFADIFFENALRNGLLTVVLPPEQVQALGALIQAAPNTAQEMHIDLQEQRLDCAGESFTFGYDSRRKVMLLQGLDDIGLSLQCQDAISDWEKKDASQRPWLYSRLASGLDS